MPSKYSYIIGGLILIISVAVAALLIARAPEPVRREPPARIPFALTGLIAAGSGAIPVYGAGTVRSLWIKPWQEQMP